MKTLQVKRLPSMFFHTGNNCYTNAEALASRNYGFEDDYIGTLTKLNDGSSKWDGYSYIYVETGIHYTDVKDIIENTYSYTSAQFSSDIKGEIYLNSLGEFNQNYSYEYVLHSSLDEAKTTPAEDITYFIKSLNLSNYNSQKYYDRNVEVSSIIYAGLQYNWAPAGTVIKDTYNQVDYEVNDAFVRYELIPHTLNQMTYTEHTRKEETGEYEMDADGNMVPVYETITYYTWDNDYGYDEENKVTYQITYTAYELTYLSYMSDIMDTNIAANINKYINNYNIDYTQPLYAYYISKADTFVKLIMNTYTLESQTSELLINYDGEYNDWFENRIEFNVNPLMLRSAKSLYNITAAEDYGFSCRYNSYIDVAAGDIQLSANATDVFKLANTTVTVNDTLALLSPYKAKVIDFTPAGNAVTGVIDLDYHYDMDINYKTTEDTTWHARRGNMLEQFKVNSSNLTAINGINYIDKLKLIDIKNCNKLTQTPNIESLNNLNVFIAEGSNIDNLKLADNLDIYYISLPNTIKAIEMNNTTFKKGIITDYSKTTNTEVEYEGTMKYTPTYNLVTLSLDNVKGFDTYGFVETWVKSIKDNNLLDSGLVNYLSLKGIDWKNADVNIIIDMYKLGIDKFTGTVELVGSAENGALTRQEYNTIKHIYGEDTLNNSSSSELHFVYNIKVNSFNIIMSVPEYTTTKVNGVSVTTETYHEVPIVVNDTDTGNAFLDELTLRGVMFGSYKNWGIIGELDKDISGNQTYSTSTVSAGDVLLYKGNQIIVVTNNSSNVVNNYIKLGTVASMTNLVDALSKLNIAGIKQYPVSFLRTDIVYVEEITFEPDDVEINLKDNEELQVIPINITVLPEDADDKSITLHYDDSIIDIIYTSEASFSIVVSKEGEAEITATANDGSLISNKCTLKITNK